MKIPPLIHRCLTQLHQAGYEAQVVGGCVRDRLMGREPHDWDICTSALPEETQRCFSNETVILTGVKHGTVTVLLEGEAIEITTYRKEENYRDHRHPERVTFVSALREDLARRDFTINGMAYDPNQGVLDYFGGQGDLQAKVIRCVGDPDRRFQEDALRILRGLRFAATLDFTLDEDTRQAMLRHKEDLRYVSAERIKTELDKLLVGSGVVRILRENWPILGVILPEVLPCVGFDQHNPHHDRDVWEHTLGAMEASPPNLLVRWTLLLHDMGKPHCFTLDDKGIGHFYGHAQESTRLAREILRRLKFDRSSMDTICTLVEQHDRILVPDRKHVLRWLNQLGEEQLRLLLAVQYGDKTAHSPVEGLPDWKEQQAAFLREMEDALASGGCYTLRQLAISGRDLLELGVPPGKAVGEILEQLLREVMGGGIPNEASALRRRGAQLARAAQKK
jgi:tRNA nucleotidyltransferase (CCA-adding enzyme)